MTPPLFSLRSTALLGAAGLLALVTACGGGGSSGGGTSLLAADDRVAPDPEASEGSGGEGGEEAPPGEGVANGGGAFQITGGPSGGLVGGVNVPITILFNDIPDIATVSSTSLQVVTVTDPSGVSPAPGGSVPQVTYEVIGHTLLIHPVTVLSPSQVEYGFVEDALYEISFGPGPGGSVIESTSGEALSNVGVTLFFRTPATAFDYYPGFPSAEIYIVDDASLGVIPGTVVDGNGDNNLTAETLAFFGNPVKVETTAPLIELPTSPVRDFIFIFDEAAIPSTLVNPIDGTSPQLTISYNSAAPPAFVPKVIPANVFISHQQLDLTVVSWQSLLSALPPGALIEAQVGAGVEDLAGNSKFGDTGNGAPDVDEFLGVAPLGPGESPESTTLVEPFDDGSRNDTTLTNSGWATPNPGLLTPIIGGGPGTLGPFLVDALTTADDLRTTRLPLGATLDFDEMLVRIPTVFERAPDVFAPMVYNFDRFFLPDGWTLKPLFDRDGDGEPDPEEYLVADRDEPLLDGLGGPLVIRSSNNLDVRGTIDGRAPDSAPLVVPSGPVDPAYADYQGQGAPGTLATLAAGNGGDGGGVLLLTSDPTPAVAIPLQSPAAFPPFQVADAKLIGATGRSSLVTATTLEDPLNDFSIINTDPGLAATLAAGELLLQPNLGVGSSLAGNSGSPNQNMDENHPVYVIETVEVNAGKTTFTVASGPGAPTLNQPSENIGNPPVSGAGDAYLIGDLLGKPGGDPTPFERQGQGSQPFVVVNEGALGIITTNGGGGGGGSFQPGTPGDSDGPASNPALNQRGGTGGMSLDDSPGGVNGAGVIRGVATVMSDTVLHIDATSSGVDLSTVAPGALEGSLVIVGAPTDGWIFEIADFDSIGMDLTIERQIVDVLDIGLMSGTNGFVPAGPQLPVLSTPSIVIMPTLFIGGGGGGGVGVSVTGTVNFSPTVLPRLKPGATGGAGTGSIMLETGRNLLITESAEIIADGGLGGEVFDLLTQLAGGGGGGAGNVVLRAVKSLLAFPGGRVTALGGEGGSTMGAGRGGSGGSGFIRIETGSDNLNPAAISFLANPGLSGENVGLLISDAGGLAHSRFYQGEFANPEFDGVLVEYEAVVGPGDGAPAVDLQWGFTDNGIFGDYEQPPFRILFNSVNSTAGGFIDAGAIDAGFYLAPDLVSARTGLVYDADAGTLLYVPGHGTATLYELDPADMSLVGSTLFDPAVATPTNRIDVVSMAYSPEFGGELFLLERLSGDIIVLDRTTLALRRRLMLPFGLQGAMAYMPLDQLVIADNIRNRLVVIPTNDPGAVDPVNTDFVITEPLSVAPIDRDGEFLSVELVGLAYDAAGPSLWATDALTRRLIEMDAAPASLGESISSNHVLLELKDATDAGLVPSALGLNGSDLFLIHAVDPLVSEIVKFSLSPLLGETELAITAFDAELPAQAKSMIDGDLFIRFRIELLGEPVIEGTEFRKVRIDRVILTYENKPL